MDNSKSELTKLDKVEKFIKHLYHGEHIKIDGRVYCMSKDYDLAVICFDENGNELDKCLKINDLSLSFLFDLADKVSDDEYFVMDANKVLRDIVFERKRK